MQTRHLVFVSQNPHSSPLIRTLQAADDNDDDDSDDEDDASAADAAPGADGGASAADKKKKKKKKNKKKKKAPAAADGADAAADDGAASSSAAGGAVGGGKKGGRVQGVALGFTQSHNLAGPFAAPMRRQSEPPTQPIAALFPDLVFPVGQVCKVSLRSS